MKAISRSYRPHWNAVPSIFDDLFSDWAGGSMSDYIPAVNVKEDDNGFEVELAAPGFKREDFNVSVDNDRLVITAKMEEEHTEEEQGKYTRREFSARAFERSFTLPKNTVNTDSVEAKYENGVLKLSLPKLDEVKPKPAKTIEIG